MSSLTTTVPGPGENRPVEIAPALDRWLIWAPVSDEPTASDTKIVGFWASRRSLIVGVRAAPPLPTAISELMS
jgi:hypothetical protein